MRIDVRYFAAARETAGLGAETLEVADGATVGALRQALIARHPALASLEGRVRYAVGERFAGEDTTLEDGDVVALIPPVSGG